MRIKLNSASLRVGIENAAMVSETGDVSIRSDGDCVVVTGGCNGDYLSTRVGARVLEPGAVWIQGTAAAAFLGSSSDSGIEVDARKGEPILKRGRDRRKVSGNPRGWSIPETWDTGDEPVAELDICALSRAAVTSGKYVLFGPGPAGGTVYGATSEMSRSWVVSESTASSRVGLNATAVSTLVRLNHDGTVFPDGDGYRIAVGDSIRYWSRVPVPFPEPHPILDPDGAVYGVDAHAFKLWLGRLSAVPESTTTVSLSGDGLTGTSSGSDAVIESKIPVSTTDPNDDDCFVVDPRVLTRTIATLPGSRYEIYSSGTTFVVASNTVRVAVATATP